MFKTLNLLTLPPVVLPPYAQDVVSVLQAAGLRPHLSGGAPWQIAISEGPPRDWDLIVNDQDQAMGVLPHREDAIWQGRAEVHPLRLTLNAGHVLVVYGPFPEWPADAQAIDISGYSSLEEDALHRDYTVTAMYWSFDDGQYVDPLGLALPALQARVLEPVGGLTALLDETRQGKGVIWRMVKYLLRGFTLSSELEAFVHGEGRRILEAQRPAEGWVTGLWLPAAEAAEEACSRTGVQLLRRCRQVSGLPALREAVEALGWQDLWACRQVIERDRY